MGGELAAVVRGPGVLAGVRCDDPVAGWDFFPTISDLIGNRKPLPAGIDGGSLRLLFEQGNRGNVGQGDKEDARDRTRTCTPFRDWILNPARLPIPPLSQAFDTNGLRQFGTLLRWRAVDQL